MTHSKLLFKLHCHDIQYGLLNWIINFLTNRSQCVSVGNSYSNKILVKSGIPQGTVLGPILFLVFINDVTSCIDGDCSIKLFADDSKIYQTSNYGKNKHFINTLNKFSEWSKDWQLNIETIKCFHLRYENSSLPLNS